MFDYLAIVTITFTINHSFPSKADLSFGRSQVEQLILDQPDMGNVIAAEPDLRQFLELSFAGFYRGARVYWDCRETKVAPADHLPTLLGYPALIRISNRFGNSAVDKCAMIVFELNNLECDNEYQALFSGPKTNKKSRDEFALALLRLEYEAAEKSRQYFKKYPIKCADVAKDLHYFETLGPFLPYNEYVRLSRIPGTSAFNHRTYFLKAYDGLIPQSQDRQQPSLPKPQQPAG